MVNPKVYVVNEPLRRDPQTGEMSRWMDLTPAAAFGELSFLLPAGHQPQDPSPVLEVLRRKLAGYRPHDYILPLGDPALIGWAIALAARAAGGQVRTLCWIPKQKGYIVAKAELWVPDDEMVYGR